MRVADNGAMLQSTTPMPWPERSHTELHDELHARPALRARSPCVVSYWVHWGMDAACAEEALALICADAGSPAPAPGARHHVLHNDGFALKFERHGEFVSWQVNRALPPLPDAPDDDTLRAALLDTSATAGLPPAFVACLGNTEAGRMLAATHVVMLHATADDWLNRCLGMVASQSERRAAPKLGLTPSGGGRGTPWPEAHSQSSSTGADDAAPVVGAWIGDGRRGALLSSLQLGADGFTRFVVLDFGLPPDQAAREAQRLCEIEAYRMLSMLGFPLAQQEAARLAVMERELQRVVDAMANDDTRDDAQAFETLTRLSAEVEHGSARTRYRFSATQAYHRIVEQRLRDLREQRIHGVQTLSGFLSRRFAPAMALCDSTAARLTDMAERINRAVSLARVRVEMQREEGNQQLFRLLAHRQKLQLRLQQAVEGLSVVAISYYALGLVGYLAKAAKGLPALEPLHIQPDVVVGIAVIPVLGGVAWFIHRLRQHMNE